ncbi:MAG: hypothetical protein JWO46_2129, partial [Nocardioidaceae bacterium]|nr:hypothetical protein [Nocardioidaceae bacterium]
MSTSDLFTPTSLVTLQGSALAAFLIPNVLGVAVPKFFPKAAYAATSLGVALAIQLSVASGTTDKDVVTWAVAVLNGFLVAASALGINQATQTGTGVGGGGGQAGGGGGTAGPGGAGGGGTLAGSSETDKPGAG